MNLNVSVGEFFDKLTILQIKAERISDPPESVHSIHTELEYLERQLVDINPPERLPAILEQLKRVNEELWDIEDQIRDKEWKKEFDGEFIELARAVYITNDKRSELKKTLNKLLGSDFDEVKSYKDYK